MNKKMLSLVIPAHNEEECIEETVKKFSNALKNNDIKHEILVINDNSTDSTESKLKELTKNIKEVKYLNNTPPNGFGFAIRKGLENFSGDYVAIVMADFSDNPSDLIKMYKKAKEGYDCVFGSRFIKGAKIKDYPIHKMILNRITNNIIKILFLIKYNDTTNAFKMYSRDTIYGLKPFLSNHFNITVELPLKSIVRGFSYAVVPTNWTNRKEGVSKLKIKEMGGRYFFIILYCYLEKLLAMGDYKKTI
ncbi:MAG: glycosyltransferase family 2 protein [Pseudomonadales bacterium]|nr:glycosyltransferase family 2 protein [Pseudomonadales bacterium]